MTTTLPMQPPPPGITDKFPGDVTPIQATTAQRAAADPILAAAPPAPPEAQTIPETGLTDTELEALVLKVLFQHGNCTGAQISDIICLSRSVAAEMLDRLREELLVGIKGSAGVSDYLYQLSDTGHQRAQRHTQRCRFVSAAPVPLEVYNQAIARQSLSHAELSLDKLDTAMGDLVLRPQMLSQIGQALNDGRGMFLYGDPGNGKTSMAERVCSAFGQCVWIPRMLTSGGEMIRLFDASCHEEVKSNALESMKYDRRWVLIRRPTIVVGGELTLEQLETRFVEAAGISEAPVHLKSNCGTLVIDDFGRQRVSSREILNRLIVPLEKQYDFLNLPSGRQIQTPFDQLLVFSTNLEPRDLVDEAFLRRIPYKIEVYDPSVDEFCQLFDVLAEQLEFQIETGSVEQLIAKHYVQTNRPFRFCHPRDLMRQVKNYCEVHQRPKVLTEEALDIAVHNYFAGL